jgi:transposase
MSGWSNRKMPAAEVVAADVAAGMTNDQLAEKYGVSAHTVMSFMYRNEIRREPKRVLTDDSIIVEALNKGMTVSAAARHFGVNRDTLRSRILRANLVALDVETRLVSFTSDLRETAEKIVVERIVHSYESGVKPRRMLISLPRVPSIHGHFGE